jgi:hypothetical protein
MGCLSDFWAFSWLSSLKGAQIIPFCYHFLQKMISVRFKNGISQAPLKLLTPPSPLLRTMLQSRRERGGRERERGGRERDAAAVAEINSIRAAAHYPLKHQGRDLPRAWPKHKILPFSWCDETERHLAWSMDLLFHHLLWFFNLHNYFFCNFSNCVF